MQNDAHVSADPLAIHRARFAHLERTTDIVRESLKEAILEGDLAAGTRLPEGDIARQFDASRTPVREALQQLAAEGLVDISPHQGAIVSQFSIEDILDIYVVREALEGVAARLAARRATEMQVLELLSLVTEMEEMGKNGDASEMAEANLRFHAAIRRAAGNKQLDRHLAQIEQGMRRAGSTTLAYPGRLPETIREHREIAQAIADHDPERAERLAIMHMSQARQIRLQMLADNHR